MAQHLLTVAEIATLRRRSRWTVYRWVREGYLKPTITTFGRYLIAPNELKKLPEFSKNTQKPLISR